MCKNNSNFHMGGIYVFPAVSNINFHISWNPFTFPPSGPGWPCMHVLVSVNRRLRITYLPLSLDAQDRPSKNKSLWTGHNFVQKQAQFVQKGFLSSQTRSVTQLCVTSCTYAQWLNRDGATAWELNREAKQAWELNSTTQDRSWCQFWYEEINQITKIWI